MLQYERNPVKVVSLQVANDKKFAYAENYPKGANKQKPAVALLVSTGKGKDNPSRTIYLKRFPKAGTHLSW